MTVGLLAREMQVYCQACTERQKDGGKLVTELGRISAYVKIQQATLKNIVMLVRELGLSPSSRLKAPDETPIDDALKHFLAGPMAGKPPIER